MLNQPRTTEDYQLRLKALEGVYQKAKDRLDGKDAEWNTRRELLEKKVWLEIKSMGHDDSSTKAVLIIGRLQAIAQELDAPRLIVAEYESLRKRYVQVAQAEDKEADLTL